MEMNKTKDGGQVAKNRALRSAVMAGKEEAVSRLLALGADAAEPLARKGQVATALGFALRAKKSNVKIVEMLLAAGANPWETADSRSWSDAWELAIMDGKSECLKAMAEVYSKDLGLPPVWVAGEKKTRSLNWDCPLSRCVKVGVPRPMHAKCIEILAPYCDIDATDGWGVTPLMHAARVGFEEGTKALLLAGANPNKQGTNGVSPLMMASKQNSRCVEILLGAGADPHAVDQSNATALHWAVKRENAKAIRILAECSDLGALDCLGRRPVECAGKKTSESVKAILEWLELKLESSTGVDVGSGRKLGAERI